jgi:Sulfate permease and related transporters (MFS superfamily)
MPQPKLIHFSMDTLITLLPASLTIALLGSIESLLSATVADGATGDRHNSNTELVAQGAANIGSFLFGGIPVTGAIARTMTNIKNGGRTPVSGIIHALVLLLILLFLSPLTKYIPMACLAGVLVIVSYNMSEWRTIKSMMHNPKSDVAVLITTFVLTVIFDLTIAIEVGLVMAIFLFMKRVMETTQISVIHDEFKLEKEGEYPDKFLHNPDLDKLTIPDGIEVYEIEGPFFFGVANKFDEIMRDIGENRAKVRIIRMRRISFIDSTGIHNLEIFIKSTQKESKNVILSGVTESVHQTLLKAGIDNLVGEDNVCNNIYSALEQAKKYL